ncbi:GNAT family N-acetyltransferase [Roseovarius salis]|uniref:GNAT family N-acetyltransferase n=1 Tax=Roseovarius salis TaxID=3376063 RepID=UPI0037C81E58
MTTDFETLCRVTEATWPAAALRRSGPWTIRAGQGGGKRVSAATAEDVVTEADLPLAEREMRALGQTPLFMIREGQEALDGVLEARGYRVVDPVNAWLGPVAPLIADPMPRGCVFDIWEPLAIQVDMWTAAGIGPGRIAVMERAAHPKTALLGRLEYTPAATAFAAIHQGIAMVHALEVVRPCRRKGMAKLVMRHAAHWAADNGADRIAALCTRANTAANRLYASLGLGVVGQYHYRTEEKDSHE